MDNQSERMRKLAADVLRLSCNTLLVNLRFMDAALSRLEPVQTDAVELAADGRLLLYNPLHILRMYRKEKEEPVRAYLHMVLHCVFRHMFVDPSICRPCWDLACDIAVENSVASLGLKAAASSKEERQKAELEKLSKKIGSLTAEKIYRYLRDTNPEDHEMKRLCDLFSCDDHRIWYMTEEERRAAGLPSKEPGGNKDGGDPNGTGQTAIGSAEDWETVSRRMQVDMETFSKQRGDRAGSMMQNLREVNREKYDYTAFLKKFAVRGETMKINDEEFDYVYYTYGLKLYGKVPLIEPLEYKEVKRIREFVIAIDTSGSTSGDLVQSFLQKTYNILQSTESFFSKINVHIIQCDAGIQEDAKITKREEFEQYIKRMKIRGLGGTDFRPVFSYVESLREKKEFQNLKGLIYFTDGFGIFPAKKPDYETAFVFVDDGQNNYNVPPWAIKLVLQKEEI